MRLFINFGNSDIRTDKDNDFVYRKGEEFRSRLSLIANALDSYDGEITSEGIFNPPLVVIHPGDGKLIYISYVKLTILKQACVELLNHGKRITEVVGFLTDQKDKGSNGQDTIDIKRILEGKYGEACFPDLKFTFQIIYDTPPDYSKMIHYYNSFFENRPRDNNEIALIAQGTPAMSYALSLACAQHNPLVKQYYASRKHGSETSIMPLHTFINQVAKEKIDGLCILLKLGNYEAAVETVKGDSFLSLIPGLELLVSYFAFRQKYLFVAANGYANQLKDINSELYDTISSSLIGLQYFDECIIKNDLDKDDCDALNDSTPYLLFESLQNARFAFETENIHLSLAFLFSYFEMYQRVVVAKVFGVNVMTHDVNKNDAYFEIDDYFRKEDLAGKNLGKLSNELNKKGFIGFSGGTPTSIINYLAKQKKLGYLEAASNLLTNIPLQRLKELRNNSPVAHNLNGVSKSTLKKALGMKFKSYPMLLDTVEEALWKMIPEKQGKWSKPSRYHDASKAIREYLNKYLSNMLS